MPCGRVLCSAQPATESSSVQTRPPWTAPIGLYADSSGVQVKTTRPGSASARSIWISPAIGGGGIAPVDHRVQVVDAGHRQARCAVLGGGVVPA